MPVLLDDDQNSAGADNDDRARKSLWNAIHVAARTIRRSWNVRTFLLPTDDLEITDTLQVPTAPTWKLVEILSALAILTSAQDVRTKKVPNLVSKTGPIEYLKNGRSLFLWTQPNMIGEDTGLAGRPDIIITRTSERPTHANAVQIVECKCQQSLGAPHIRAEFAKGFDLKVRSYFIWSFFSPSQRLIEGAKGLGIDLTAIGFDTAARDDLLVPERLLYFVSTKLEESSASENFASLIEATADQVSRKLLS
jgi:hypothetical protein